MLNQSAANDQVVFVDNKRLPQGWSANAKQGAS